MNSYYPTPDEHSTPSERPRHYDREARRARRRKRIMMRRLRILSAVALVGLTVTAAMALIDRQPEQPETPVSEQSEQAMVSLPEPEPVVVEPEEPVWAITHTDTTAQIRSDFPSQYGILLELESGKVLAARDSTATINPASMTKILTLLVSAEHVTD